MSASDIYPRTLIAGRGFDQSSGAGITLSSLFHGWPKERLAAMAAVGESLESDVCQQYYVLGSDDTSWVWPLSRLAHSVPSGPVLQDTGDTGESLLTKDTALRPPGDLGEMSLARRAFWASMTRSGAQQFLIRYRISDRLARWIRSYRPEVVYTHLESLQSIGFVDDLISRWDLPLVIHMMDDWPMAPVGAGLLSPVIRRLIDTRLRRLLDKAACTMGISRYMCGVYEKRYGREFLPFHNVLDTRAWTVQPRSDWKASEPFRIVYAGRVGIANEESLRDVAAVVAELADRGMPVRLEIYCLARSPFPPGTWPESRAVRVLPAVAYGQIPRLLVEADLLLLPLGFSTQDLAYARYSMPTKVAEYLGSGAPVLVYCPEDTALAHYARAEGWAAVVGTRDRAELTRTIASLVRHEKAREQLGRVALEVSERDNDPERIRADFVRALHDASTACPPASSR
jgi:glycosyltransferase involved in cell wall biosynthesis